MFLCVLIIGLIKLLEAFCLGKVSRKTFAYYPSGKPVPPQLCGDILRLASGHNRYSNIIVISISMYNVFVYTQWNWGTIVIICCLYVGIVLMSHTIATVYYPDMSSSSSANIPWNISSCFLQQSGCSYEALRFWDFDRHSTYAMCLAAR